MYEDKEQERKHKQKIADERARIQQIKENVGKRVDELMRHIVPTSFGFIWNGENTVLFDPMFLEDGWRDTLTQESSTALAVVKMLISRLGYSSETHFISTEMNGISILEEGNLLESEHEYFIREV